MLPPASTKAGATLQRQPCPSCDDTGSPETSQQLIPTEKGHFFGLLLVPLPPVSLCFSSDTSLCCWLLKPKGQPLMSFKLS